MKTKPKPRYRVQFDLDLWWHVRWRDNRGNQCDKKFGSEEAAQAWAAQEEARDGQQYVKGQS